MRNRNDQLLDIQVFCFVVFPSSFFPWSHSLSVHLPRTPWPAPTEARPSHCRYEASRIDAQRHGPGWLRAILVVPATTLAALGVGSGSTRKLEGIGGCVASGVAPKYVQQADGGAFKRLPPSSFGFNSWQTRGKSRSSLAQPAQRNLGSCVSSPYAARCSRGSCIMCCMMLCLCLPLGMRLEPQNNRQVT